MDGLSDAEIKRSLPVLNAFSGGSGLNAVHTTEGFIGDTYSWVITSLEAGVPYVELCFSGRRADTCIFDNYFVKVSNRGIQFYSVSGDNAPVQVKDRFRRTLDLLQ